MRAVLCVLVVAAALAGCGGDDAADQTAAPQAAPSAATETATATPTPTATATPVAGAGGPEKGVSGTCSRTRDPADIALPAHALGAAYLGGTRLGPMAGAGLITELRPGALAALSAALSWDPAPWCPMIF